MVRSAESASGQVSTDTLSHIVRASDMENEVLDTLKEYLPLLIPIIIIELVLMVAAIVDLIRREKTRGPKWMWVIIILFLNLIGPIVYFVVGRDDE